MGVSPGQQLTYWGEAPIINAAAQLGVNVVMHFVCRLAILHID